MKTMATTSARPQTSPRRPSRSKPAAKPGAVPQGKSAEEQPSSSPTPTAAQTTAPTTPLADLKRAVFALAKVSSTKELKRQNVDLHHLDFRRKVSWSQALTVLQKAQEAYPDWHHNPPEEYRELFSAIDAASDAYARSIEKGLQLSEELERAADDLEALSGELQQEAEELKAIEQASRKQRRARSLN